ncbi:CDP-glycerol glycerophosphotransferase family protein [Aeromicrobium ginsengisoli]|uniref:Glycosyl transferase n=1 Tax=Aeromicrobium ginsengisoli TaxID=363867 RepID=A0A5M4FKC5_9ACTN|nr:CDP-glycerol glycerophosphotransferase family protein [Aeromicrobium ginsengisoli]KAA1400045.1 glycosyl transferase [Aeromicrobium ginsengisoli]
MTGDVRKPSKRSQTLRTQVAERPRLVVLPLVGAALVVLLVLWPDAGTVASLLVLLAGTLLVPRISESPSYAYGLPGVPDGPPRPSRIPVEAHTWVSLGAAAIAVLLTVVGASWPAFAALAAVAVAAWLACAATMLRYLRHGRRVRQALEAYAPTIAMGFAGRSGGPWQLRMWEPYLLRSGERCVVITLHEKYLPLILDGADLTSPLVQLGSRGTRDLDSLFVPSIRAVFYVQNAQANKGFMAHTDLTHVWLNHGDSDKPANFNPRHALYDVLVVCGQAGIDRYERHGIHVAPEKFRILGRPQASGVRPARGPIAELESKVVLYAPTWQGLDESVNFSSLEKGPEIVRALIDRDVTVIFRPHPLSHRWRIRRAVIQEIHAILHADKQSSHRRHQWGKTVGNVWSVVDCANRSDALISDVSSVVSDFLQSEKPYVMTSMRAGIEAFRAEFSVAETGYVLLGDLSNLDEVLDDLLVRDPLATARAERKRYVLGDFVGEESADAFAGFVRELVRGA